MTHNTINVAGIDTGKAKLDIALSPGGQELQVDNSPDGHAALAAWLTEHGVIHAGIEASGGYEAAIIEHLHAQGIAITRFQPAQVRSYAGYRLQRAKNDKIDARMIAACTHDAEPTIVHEPRFSALAEQLTELPGELFRDADLLRACGELALGHVTRREPEHIGRVRFDRAHDKIPTALSSAARFFELRLLWPRRRKKRCG